jgi:peptidoglycan/LPS O-acetylase OafA/YrhL
MAFVPPTSALAEDLRATTRWPALDGIRGLAVLAVVAYHAYRMVVLGSGAPSTRDIDPRLWPLSTARFALDAFFVLSGFLIVSSWTSLQRRHGRLGPAAWAYARKRAARILPAYWVSLLILVPLVAPHLLRSPGKLGLLATVQQYVVPTLPSEVNVVYWSLTTEVHFYVLAPLFAFLLARFGGWRVVAGCAALSLLWRYHLPFDLAASFTFGRTEQFVLGAAAGELVRAHDRGDTTRLVAWLRARGMGVVLVAGLVALGTFEGAVLDGVGHGPASKLLHTVVALVLAGMLVRILTVERRPGGSGASFLEHPGLRFAGLVSYGVYLCHYPLLHHGLRAAGIEAGDGTSVVRAVAVVVGLGVAAFVVGTASYVLVERRFLQTAAPVPSPPVIDLRDDHVDRELVSR